MSSRASTLGRFLVFALIPWLTCWPISAQADIERSQLIALGASVVKIEAERAQGGYSLGSGVVIAADRVVTNCHVTRDAERVYILRGGDRRPVVAQLRDSEHDLCVLRVPRLEAPVARISNPGQLELGQPVEALGYTGGLNIQYSSGAVIALHRLDGGQVIQSSNWFNSGASGGGLFDASQALVGILTFRLRGGERHYFAAPAAWLIGLSDAADDRFVAVAPDRSGQLPYWQRPAANQPRFLRAGSMERDKRWPELQELAEQWTHDDIRDPEPWYFLGLALSQMDRLPPARQALACSLAIQPDGIEARTLLDHLASTDVALARINLDTQSCAVSTNGGTAR
ncbi:MAG: serine protease [Burkholderiaceae bacterium]